MEQPNFDLYRMALIPVRGPLGIEAMDVGPPAGGSFIELSGPKKTPKRPYLEIYAAPTGVAARVLRGDSEPLPFAVLLPIANGSSEPTIVPLPEPPLAVARRSDGLWAVYRTRVVQHDSAGRVMRSLELAANHAVASLDDGVWVMDLDYAWHIDGSGAVRGPHPWGDGFQASVAAGADLCMIDRRPPRLFLCLSPSGEERVDSLPAVNSLEQLLAYGKDMLVRQYMMSVVWHSGGTSTELPVQSAGLDAAGQPFVCSAPMQPPPSSPSPGSGAGAPAASGTPAPAYDGSWITLYRAGREPRRIEMPPEASTPPKGQGSATPTVKTPMRVTAVQGERVLLQSYTRALWLDGDRVQAAFNLDDATYRREVFPHGWTLAGTRPFAATPEGALYISATGPEGMAIIRVKRR